MSALQAINEKHGKTIFIERLPPHHPKLKCIEFAWSLMKHDVRILTAKGSGSVVEMRTMVRRVMDELMDDPQRVWSHAIGGVHEQDRTRNVSA